jgi:hypothetical protein
VVAVFEKAKCVHKQSKLGTGPFFRAKAKSTDGKSTLVVEIGHFVGFKTEYEVEPGYVEGAPIVEVNVDGTPYSNTYPPPAPIPTIGRILFREAGHLMGVGYGPAMFDYHQDSAVTFTGVIECERPTKKGKPGKH